MIYLKLSKKEAKLVDKTPYARSNFFFKTGDRFTKHTMVRKHDLNSMNVPEFMAKDDRQIK